MSDWIIATDSSSWYFLSSWFEFSFLGWSVYNLGNMGPGNWLWLLWFSIKATGFHVSICDQHKRERISTVKGIHVWLTRLNRSHFFERVTHRKINSTYANDVKVCKLNEKGTNTDLNQSKQSAEPIVFDVYLWFNNFKNSDPQSLNQH